MQLATNARELHQPRPDRSKRWGQKAWRQKEPAVPVSAAAETLSGEAAELLLDPSQRLFYKLPQKVRRLALKSALSSKALDNKIVVVDEFNFDQPKTKAMMQALEALKVGKKPCW
jgi:large subunit ribosomal protein L4